MSRLGTLHSSLLTSVGYCVASPWAAAVKRGAEYRDRRRAQQQRDLQQPAPATVASAVAQTPAVPEAPPAAQPAAPAAGPVLAMAPPNFSSPSPANVGSVNVFATMFDWEDSLDGLPPAADDWPVILDQLPKAKAARAAAGIHEQDYMDQLWNERLGCHSHADDDDELD